MAGLPPNFQPKQVRAFGDETDTPGGWFDEAVRDRAPEGGVLVGLKIGVATTGGNDAIGSARAIYRVGEKESFGRSFGKKQKRVVVVKARPGYAVGAMAVKAGTATDGLGLYFMRIEGDRLDVNDVYASEWLGGAGGGAPRILGGDGRPAIGLVVRLGGNDLTGLGLLSPMVRCPRSMSRRGFLGCWIVSPLPAGFRVVGWGEFTQGDRRAPAGFMFAGPGNRATAEIKFEYGDFFDNVNNRRNAARRYIKGARKVISAAKMKLAEENIPDVESATFEKPLVVELMGEGDSDKEIFVHQEIFFTDKGYNVLVTGEDEDAVATLVKWVQTIKPETLRHP